MLQMEEVKNKNNIVNLTELRALLIGAFDVDYTHHKIIQEPKLSLWRIYYDDIFRRKKMIIRRKSVGTLQ